MKKLDLSNVFKGMQTKIAKCSPEIFTGAAIILGGVTVVLAVRATPKAMTLIEEKKEELEVETLTPVDVVKAGWKPYIPAFITGVSSVVLLVCARSSSARRTAAVATAYKITETAYNEYKGKVAEMLGEKKEQEIRDDIAKDQVNRHPVDPNKIVILNKGFTLCLDALTGQYFRSDIERIRKAENEINNRLFMDQYASLNEFFALIGEEECRLGEELGWNIDSGMLKVQFSSQLTSDDEPCVVISYSIMPKYEFNKLTY